MAAIIDYRGKTPRKTPSGIPLITARVVKGGRIKTPTEFIAIEDYDSWMRRGVPRRGDVVITTEAPLGEVAQLDRQRVALAQRLILLRGKSGILNNRFLNFLIQSAPVQDQLRARASGTTVLGIKQRELRQIGIVLPPIQEQHAIAHILGTLDDKIELNRRMNRTLEEMARVLFKSWFVDFDPVHAKATLKHHDTNHSPLEGESARQGRSPQSSRWGEIKRFYTQQTLERVKNLRQYQTDSEELLWHYLCRKQLDGYKFWRQQPIGPYVVDFACMSRKLVIELDGGQHAEQHNYDKKREDYLRGKGYRILRFWNNQVFQDCMDVLEAVWQALVGPPPHQPSPGGAASATPLQGGSDWSVERARAYLDRMDPTIAALFPERFVDSELGPIPEGWEVKALGQCIDVERGLSYKGSALSSSGVPMHNLNSIYEGGGYKNDGIKYYSGDYQPRNVVKPGDVIVANTEQGHDRLLIGFAAIVPKCFGDNGLFSHHIFSHHIYRVLPKSSFAFAPDFVCRLLNTQATHDTVSGYATGTTVNMLPVDALRIPRFVAPPPQVVTKFSSIAEVARIRQEKFIAETRILDAVRDALLPKLVSGELRVGEL